ncbi:hypothetical protein D046_1581B, partial [Vibrio parahaemolyticus V-223/04]|jgi:hypothetical protein
LGKQ